MDQCLLSLMICQTLACVPLICSPQRLQIQMQASSADELKWMKRWNKRRERECLRWMNVLDICSCASHDHVPCDGFRTPTRYKINFESHRWHWCISCNFPATSWFFLHRALTQHIHFSFFPFFFFPLSARIRGKMKSFFLHSVARGKMWLNAWLLQ